MESYHSCYLAGDATWQGSRICLGRELEILHFCLIQSLEHHETGLWLLAWLVMGPEQPSGGCCPPLHNLGEECLLHPGQRCWTADLEKLTSQLIQGNRERRKDGGERWKERRERDAGTIPGGRTLWQVRDAGSGVTQTGAGSLAPPFTMLTFGQMVNSLCLSFFICKMGILIVPPQKLVFREDKMKYHM